MAKLIFNIFALSLLCRFTTSQTTPCKYTSGETTYDFTKIAGKDVTVSAGGYDYSLNICGTSYMKCENDPDGITSGMVVETKSGKDVCNVLGQYDDSVTSASWSLLYESGGTTGVALRLDNGSPSSCPNGVPRQMALYLVCGTSEEDSKFTVEDNGDCSYTIRYNTCLACAKGCAGGGGGGGGGFPNPAKKAVSAVYQGKCGLGQIGLGLIGKSPDQQTKLANIAKTHLDNIVTSCNECKLTAPDIEKFLAPQTPSRRSLLQQMLKTASSGGSVMPSNVPAFIPSAPCNCNVKPLSNDQLSFLKKEATAPGGEAMKMCRLHLTMTKLDGTGNTGTIKNFFPLPYVSSCDGKFLNDQVQIAATAFCMLSSSTDVACRSVIECDGDATWWFPFLVAFGSVLLVTLLMCAAHRAGKRSILLSQKGINADAELGSYVPLSDGTIGKNQA